MLTNTIQCYNALKTYCRFVIFSAFYMDFTEITGTRSLSGKRGADSPLVPPHLAYTPDSLNAYERTRQKAQSLQFVYLYRQNNDNGDDDADDDDDDDDSGDWVTIPVAETGRVQRKITFDEIVHGARSY